MSSTRSKIKINIAIIKGLTPRILTALQDNSLAGVTVSPATICSFNGLSPFKIPDLEVKYEEEKLLTVLRRTAESQGSDSSDVADTDVLLFTNELSNSLITVIGATVHDAGLDFSFTIHNDYSDDAAVRLLCPFLPAQEIDSEWIELLSGLSPCRDVSSVQEKATRESFTCEVLKKFKDLFSIATPEIGDVKVRKNVQLLTTAIRSALRTGNTAKVFTSLDRLVPLLIPAGATDCFRRSTVTMSASAALNNDLRGIVDGLYVGNQQARIASSRLLLETCVRTLSDGLVNGELEAGVGVLAPLFQQRELMGQLYRSAFSAKDSKTLKRLREKIPGLDVAVAGMVRPLCALPGEAGGATTTALSQVAADQLQVNSSNARKDTASVLLSVCMAVAQTPPSAAKSFLQTSPEVWKELAGTQNAKICAIIESNPLVQSFVHTMDATRDLSIDECINKSNLKLLFGVVSSSSASSSAPTPSASSSSATPPPTTTPTRRLAGVRTIKGVTAAVKALSGLVGDLSLHTATLTSPAKSNTSAERAARLRSMTTTPMEKRHTRLRLLALLHRLFYWSGSFFAAEGEADVEAGVTGRKRKGGDEIVRHVVVRFLCARVQRWCVEEKLPKLEHVTVKGTRKKRLFSPKWYTASPVSLLPQTHWGSAAMRLDRSALTEILQNMTKTPKTRQKKQKKKTKAPPTTPKKKTKEEKKAHLIQTRRETWKRVFKDDMLLKCFGGRADSLDDTGSMVVTRSMVQVLVLRHVGRIPTPLKFECTSGRWVVSPEAQAKPRPLPSSLLRHARGVVVRGTEFFGVGRSHAHALGLKAAPSLSRPPHRTRKTLPTHTRLASNCPPTQNASRWCREATEFSVASTDHMQRCFKDGFGSLFDDVAACDLGVKYSVVSGRFQGSDSVASRGASLQNGFEIQSFSSKDLAQRFDGTRLTSHLLHKIDAFVSASKSSQRKTLSNLRTRVQTARVDRKKRAAVRMLKVLVQPARWTSWTPKLLRNPPSFRVSTVSEFLAAKHWETEHWDALTKHHLSQDVSDRRFRLFNSRRRKYMTIVNRVAPTERTLVALGSGYLGGRRWKGSKHAHLNVKLRRTFERHRAVVYVNEYLTSQRHPQHLCLVSHPTHCRTVCQNCGDNTLLRDAAAAQCIWTAFMSQCVYGIRPAHLCPTLTRRTAARYFGPQ